jgi:hypothetical protein
MGSDQVDEASEECMLQMAVHADPRGWLGHMPKDWAENWMLPMLVNRAVGLKEALDMGARCRAPAPPLTIAPQSASISSGSTRSSLPPPPRTRAASQRTQAKRRLPASPRWGR